MMHALLSFACLLAGSLSLTCASAASDEIRQIFETGRPTTTLDIDNDSLMLNRADGLYTSGVRLTQNYRKREADSWVSAGWRLGQQLYTPKNAQLYPSQLSALDRPYAGWLYGGFFYRVENGDGSEVAFGLDLGCLGPCALGRQTQEALHDLLRQPQPHGWSTQLSTELGAVAHLGGRGPYWRITRSVDLRPGVAARIGNIFTDASADLSLRVGQLQPLPDAATMYGFLRAGVRAVAYDATLQGGLFVHESQRTVEPKRVAGEVETGLQWQSRQWAVRVSVVVRSNEIRGMSEGEGRQDFMRIVISYSP
jgi:hypothetical protein